MKYYDEDNMDKVQKDGLKEFKGIEDADEKDELAESYAEFTCDEIASRLTVENNVLSK